MVLFFDNSTMDFGAQARAREAAAKFIDANTGPNRLMAVVNYGGSVQLAQNFTANTERLKQVVAGVKFSNVSPDPNNPMNAPVEVASMGMPSLGNAAANFGVWDELLALRSMAKSLATVPGRKSLILFTAGFMVSVDNLSELTAAIDACNKANVAVYPIDVRGSGCRWTGRRVAAASFRIPRESRCCARLLAWAVHSVRPVHSFRPSMAGAPEVAEPAVAAAPVVVAAVEARAALRVAVQVVAAAKAARRAALRAAAKAARRPADPRGAAVAAPPTLTAR